MTALNAKCNPPLPDWRDDPHGTAVQVAKDADGFDDEPARTEEHPKLERRSSIRSVSSLASVIKLRAIKTTKQGRLKFKFYHAFFVLGGVSLLVCLIQLFTPPPFGLMQSSAEVAQQPFSDGCEDGMERCICPRETICADSVLFVILLTISRCSVFFDYPLYMFLFLSKANHLRTALQKSLLSVWIDFSDMHHIHAMFGIVVGIETMSHSLFHILRWSLRRDDIQLLWNTQTGVTGLIVMIITPFIAWPMAVPFLKKLLSFELRKGLHYLSWLWGATLMAHAPQRIFWLVGVSFVTYAADWVFGIFMKSYLIEDMSFRRAGDNCIVIEFENPVGMEKFGSSYLYLMIPWLSRCQFHAFSVFPHPYKPNHSSLCISANGGWTRKLLEEIAVPTVRAACIVGPFYSPFSSRAIKADNVVAIASGIGITPTLSLDHKYGNNKRINIVWVCKDPGLIEYILHSTEFGTSQHGFTLIYYTGSRGLVLPKQLPPNIFINYGRPDLNVVIAGIISCIETGEELPEELYEIQQKLADISFDTRVIYALNRILSMYTREQIFEFAVENSCGEDDEICSQCSQSTRKSTASPSTVVRRNSMQNNLSTAPPSADGRRNPDTVDSNLSCSSRVEGATEMHRASAALEHSSVSIAQGRYEDGNKDEESPPCCIVEVTSPSAVGRCSLMENGPSAQMVDVDSVQSGCTEGIADIEEGFQTKAKRVRRSKKQGRQFSLVVEHAPLIEPLVSREGLHQTIQKFLGDTVGDYSVEDLNFLFNRIDTDNSGLLCRSEFNAFFDSAEKLGRDKNRGSDFQVGDLLDRTRKITSQISGLHAKDTVAGGGSMMPKDVFDAERTMKRFDTVCADKERLKTWSLLYCGGNAAIEQTVRDIGRKRRIARAVEKFDW